MYPTLKSNNPSSYETFDERFFSFNHIEFIAEISIGAGIQPISDMMNGSDARCHGDGATKFAGIWRPPLITAIITAIVVANVKEIITNFEIPSRTPYPPRIIIAHIKTINIIVICPTESPKPFGIIFIIIAPVSIPTAAVFTIAENTFNIKNTQR